MFDWFILLQADPGEHLAPASTEQFMAMRRYGIVRLQWDGNMKNVR